METAVPTADGSPAASAGHAGAMFLWCRDSKGMVQAASAATQAVNAISSTSNATPSSNSD